MFNNHLALISQVHVYQNNIRYIALSWYFYSTNLTVSELQMSDIYKSVWKDVLKKYCMPHTPTYGKMWNNYDKYKNHSVPSDLYMFHDTFHDSPRTISRSESYSVLTTISHFSRKRTLKFLMCWFYISIHL